MTEDNQNKDIHWVNHNRVKNRVSGNHLPDDKPICDILELDNYKITPSSTEHILQKCDYIILVERILVTSIPYLGFCSDVINLHIPHKHSKECANKTTKVVTSNFLV